MRDKDIYNPFELVPLFKRSLIQIRLNLLCLNNLC